MEVVSGTGEVHDVNVNVDARLHKTSEAVAVALGEALNITTDMVDASKLAWLTGDCISITF